METHRERSEWGWIFLAVALAFVAQACSQTPTQTLNPNTFYKRDLKLKVNGIEAEGAIVVPASPSYKIEGESYGKMDLLTLTSCHREWSAQDQGNNFEYEYAPTILEADFYCPISIEGNEKKKGRHGWGFIDFESRDFQLPALLQCNGTGVTTNGVSICQSRAGLIQKITFPGPVTYGIDGKCGALPLTAPAPSPTQLGSAAFEFKLPLKQCVYLFREVNEPHRLHRLTTIGYEAVLFRED